MNEEYRKCELGPAAADLIKDPLQEACLALINDGHEIVHIFSPGTSWTTAKTGARFFECGYGLIVCEVSFELFPKFKIYKSLNDLVSTNDQSVAKTVQTDYSSFTEMSLSPMATKKFQANNFTNFMGIKVGNKVLNVFPRGTSINQISNLSKVYMGDVVLVQARATYVITGLAKVEKTYTQLKQN